MGEASLDNHRDGEQPTADPSVADLTFEEAFGALEAAVDALSRGGLAIEELVAFYERGVGLARVCNDLLDAAELRVRELRDGLDGPELVPFQSQSND
jgi:exodeoxyribonuclease VII small subunit